MTQATPFKDIGDVVETVISSLEHADYVPPHPDDVQDDLDDEREYADKLRDRDWRLNNLYTIQDKYGNDVIFKCNRAQRKLLKNMHYLNIILKARQMGFSTFILVLMLDCMIWNTNFASGIVADTLSNAKKFLKRIRYSYDRMPEDIRELVTYTVANAEDVEFSNGSRVSVGVSLRSDTYNLIHISEYGKICAKFPDKAKEVKSGALNTIAPKQLVFIESTAEGRGGDFFDKTERARKFIAKGIEPTSGEYKFHFFPWYEDPTYQTDERVMLTADDIKYFKDLRDNHRINLTREQRWWYAAKWCEQEEDMKKEFPSTPDEAFMGARDGAYFAKKITNLRELGAVGAIPFDPRSPVYTFWDLGVGDSTSIWLMQVVAGKYRFVGFYENSGEGMDFYFDWLDKWRAKRGAVWGGHYAPHDVEHRRMGRQAKSIKTISSEIGWDFEVVERTPDKLNAIHAVRTLLPQCEFDEVECHAGLLHLENYSRDWDDKYSVWKKHPRHDEHSHCADAFMTFADGFEVQDDTEYDYEPPDTA